MCPKHLAVVDNNESVRKVVKKFFYDDEPNVDVSTYDDADMFLETYKYTRESVVLLDFDTLNGNAIKIIYGVEKINPDVIILLMTEQNDEDTDICISKPFKNINNFTNNIIDRVAKLSSDALKRGLKLDFVVDLLQTRKVERTKCQTGT